MNRRRTRSLRAGSLMVEALGAVMLITVALVGVSHLLIAVGRHQGTLESRRVAHLTAANLMEEAMSLSYEDLTDDRFTPLVVQYQNPEILPAIRANVRLESVDEQPAAKQIVVEVTWQNIARSQERVLLVAWKYSSDPQP